MLSLTQEKRTGKPNLQVKRPGEEGVVRIAWMLGIFWERGMGLGVTCVSAWSLFIT